MSSKVKWRYQIQDISDLSNEDLAKENAIQTSLSVVLVVFLTVGANGNKAQFS